MSDLSRRCPARRRTAASPVSASAGSKPVPSILADLCTQGFPAFPADAFASAPAMEPAAIADDAPHADRRAMEDRLHAEQRIGQPALRCGERLGAEAGGFAQMATGLEAGHRMLDRMVGNGFGHFGSSFVLNARSIRRTTHAPPPHAARRIRGCGWNRRRRCPRRRLPETGLCRGRRGTWPRPVARPNGAR